MKNFASFLTEATVGGGDTYRASTKIVEFLGKKLSQEYAPLIAMVEKYRLTPEQHYTFICSLIDGRRKHYFNYKAYKTDKSTDDEKLLIWACSKEYEIGAREAKMYLADMKDDVKNALKAKWKDSYDFTQKS